MEQGRERGETASGPQSAPIRVLIVDDHKIVRNGLRTFLSTDDEFEVVGEAQNGRQAVEQARALRPDVVLMDLLMPEMDGIAATQAIKRDLPDIEVIALTSVLEDASVVGAVRAGAIGYLLKDTELDELHRAIRAAYAGQVTLTPQAQMKLATAVQLPHSPERLTERETEVLRMVAKGLSNKEIAAQLAVGERTVKTHLTSILGKIGAQSRTQAALYAVRIGLVSA